jgi:hypothetical protein
MSENFRRFKVGLSFPGEHRILVEEISEKLAAIYGKEQILYDKYLQGELARPNCDIYMQELYRKDCDLIIVFICPEYQKTWCGIEWRSIRDFMYYKDTSKRIMFVKCGDATLDEIFNAVDGVFKTLDIYITLNEIGIDGLVNEIVKRHNSLNGKQLEEVMEQLDYKNYCFDIILQKIFQRQNSSGEIRMHEDLSNNNPDYPPVFFTMYTIGLSYNIPKYSQQIKKSVQWLYSKIDDDGFFNDNISINMLPDSPGGVERILKKSVNNYRHSGETLTVLLLMGEYNTISLNLLNNLLKVQNVDGGWAGASPDSTSQPLATILILQALNQRNISHLYKLSPNDSESLANRVSTAKNKALEWLVVYIKKGTGIWYNCSFCSRNDYYIIGNFIDTIADLLLDKYLSFTTELVEKIMRIKKDFCWHSEYDKPDIPSTVILLSALLRLRVAGMKIEFDEIENIKNLIMGYISNNEEIDTDFLCHAASVFKLCS